MSSILDALNKLEQEKAQASREAERTDTDPVSIANELVGRSVMRDRVTLRVTPAALLVSVGALVVALIAISFIAAVMLLQPRDETAPPQVAALPNPSDAKVDPTPPVEVKLEAPVTAAPSTGTSTTIELTAPAADATKLEPKPSETLVSAPAASAELPKPEVPKADPPAPARVAATPPRNDESETSSTETTIAPKTETVIAPKPEVSKPEPDPPAAAPRRPRTRVASRTDSANESSSRALPGSAISATQTTDIKLETLPILTPQDQMRFGFVRLKVNMVKPSGDTNPQGSAILTLVEEGADGQAVPNRMPFYEGQRIQNSQLRLFKVGPDRVGIEDVRSGERYQLPI